MTYLSIPIGYFPSEIRATISLIMGGVCWNEERLTRLSEITINIVSKDSLTHPFSLSLKIAYYHPIPLYACIKSIQR